ncbi:MAG: hypothetical protein ACRDZ3_13165 [Acidimicrobiia bacterium]
MPDGAPRVDELFSRAVVAQLAEQRAQRETFTELERKVERLEALMSTRFSDMSRLLRSGEVEMRLEVLEEEISGRFNRIEQTLATSGSGGVEGLDTLVERLDRVEDALRADDAGRRIASLELSIAERLGHLEESVRGEDQRARLETLERELAERVARLEELVREREPAAGSLLDMEIGLTGRLEALEQQLAAGLRHLDEAGVANGGGPSSAELVTRLETLEGVLGERFGHLEETVRSEEIGRRLKQLELSIDERSGRLEEFVRTSDVERRLEELAQSMDERSGRLEELAGTGDLERRLEELATAVDERLAELRSALEATQKPDDRVDALDQAMGYRLTRLEGTLRRMEEHTATHLEKLAEASAAAEVGILERIIAESQVVAAHFASVRPVIEAAASAGPELENALVELRRLARSAANGEATGGHPALDLSNDEDNSPEELFLPPEETPIPDRRFGGILPRRDR